jgi:hypothetical protein
MRKHEERSEGFNIIVPEGQVQSNAIELTERRISTESLETIVLERQVQ